MKALLLGLALALPACAQADPAQPAADNGASPLASPSSAPPVAIASPAMGADLPPCPGINPDIRRPPGSNCLGITPDQCGADAAQGYVGKRGTPAVREALRQLALDPDNGNFRWIPYGTAVIEDLRPQRLNVDLDAAGRIVKIDCY